MSVEHGDTGWIPETSLTRKIMISISQSNTFHRILIWRLVLWSIIVGAVIVELFEQGLIVLKVACPGMKEQYAHEDIFVV